jgi:hypothetical protein
MARVHIYQACTITNPAKLSVSARKTPHEYSVAGTVFPCINNHALHFIRQHQWQASRLPLSVHRIPWCEPTKVKANHGHPRKLGF